MQRAVMCDIIICIYMYASDVAEPATTDRDTYTCVFVMLCIAVATFSYHKLICYCGYVLDNLCVSIKIYCRIRHYYRRLPSSSVCKLQRKLWTFSWNRNRSFIGWFWYFPSAVFVCSPQWVYMYVSLLPCVLLLIRFFLICIFFCYIIDWNACSDFSKRSGCLHMGIASVSVLTVY